MRPIQKNGPFTYLLSVLRTAHQVKSTEASHPVTAIANDSFDGFYDLSRCEPAPSRLGLAAQTVVSIVSQERLLI
jgi:hypothetical protein